MTTTASTGRQRRELAEVFVALLEADPLVCDRNGLAGLVAQGLRVRNWLDAFDTKVARRTAALAREGKAEAPANLLAGGGRRGKRDAEAAAERGAICEQLPVVADALENGELSAAHADAIAALARSLDDAGKGQLAECQQALVNAAASLPPEEFGRECAQLGKQLSGDDGISRQESLRRQRNVRRWVDKHTGMHKTLISLDPLADSEMWTAINAAVAAARARQQDDDLTFDQLQADTVVEMITGERAEGGGGERVPEVSVLIDLKTLLEGCAHHGTVVETADGVPLPVSTIRRLCCDAWIIPIVLGANGEVLDVGREQRLANRAQRRALRAMYRSCAHPGCTVSFEHCRIHHVIFFELGGRTDLANLIPLCERHHHLVHEGGWGLTLTADRKAIWTRPDGTVWTDTSPNRSPPQVATPDRGNICRLAEELEQMLRESLATRAPP